ncbi:dicarboxylate transport [Zymomonas mobilis]|uniref:Dicarboxylate transport n=2 Tax=Zymomonas mobilis TaxID=542 RepID=A0A542W0Q7_ZYMMB|nr:dicarboxylate transport [Zymomonas mobilis]
MIFGRWLIGREVNQLHMKAHYRLTRLDPTIQQLDNLVIGDPDYPDLTADRVVIHLKPLWHGLAISSIHFDKLRLYGRLDQKGFDFGNLDALKSYMTTSGNSSGLPILDVDLKDARMRLRTAYGTIGMAVDGSGNLANGFQGNLAVSMPHFSSEACQIEKGHLFLKTSVSSGKPYLHGPVTAETMRCKAADLFLRKMDGVIDGHLNKALDNWEGGASISAPEIASSGQSPWQLSAVSGRVAAKGDFQQAKGQMDISGLEQMALVSGGKWHLASNFNLPFAYFSDARKGDSLLVDSHLSLENAHVKADFSSLSVPDGTPLFSLVQRLRQNLTKLAGDVSADTEISLDNHQGNLTATLKKAVVRGATDQKIQFSGAADWQEKRQIPWHFGGDLSFKGEGLPTALVHLNQLGTYGVKGEAKFEPYRDNLASITLTPVSFLYEKQHFELKTQANISGPIGNNGHVDSLLLPIDVEGQDKRIAINRNCFNLRAEKLVMSGITSQKIVLPLCPVEQSFLRVDNGRLIEGGARLDNPTISGVINNQPFTLRVKTSSLFLGRQYAELSGLQFNQKGDEGDADTHLSVDHLTANLNGMDGEGDLTGVSGRLGMVPFLFSNGAAHWEWQNKGGERKSENTDIVLHGAVDIADADQASPRFLPMRSQDLLMQINTERLHITAGLDRPIDIRSVHLLDTRIEHHFSDSRGHVLFHVNKVVFDKTLQPEQITPLSLGIFADVKGSLSGQGRIDWQNKKIVSTGDFVTNGLDFAAAFGTVSGFKGKVAFSDLLNLKTPANQLATVDEINAGLAIKGGQIHYQLLPNRVIVIEKGNWPFFDGHLTLDGAVLDFGHTGMHKVVFHVSDMDSAPLVDNLQLKNLFVSGRFDGVLPIEFSANSGKIEGGHLASRVPGGVVSYVGPVSNAHQGMLGKLTFDVLKGVRYGHLDVGLNGSLDGDFISSIQFGGVREVETKAPRSYLAREMEKLPFHFNVQVKAPFRGLLNAMRSYNNPRSVLNQSELSNEGAF